MLKFNVKLANKELFKMAEEKVNKLSYIFHISTTVIASNRKYLLCIVYLRLGVPQIIDLTSLQENTKKYLDMSKLEYN